MGVGVDGPVVATKEVSDLSSLPCLHGHQVTSQNTFLNVVPLPLDLARTQSCPQPGGVGEPSPAGGAWPAKAPEAAETQSQWPPAEQFEPEWTQMQMQPQVGWVQGWCVQQGPMVGMIENANVPMQPQQTHPQMFMQPQMLMQEPQTHMQMQMQEPQTQSHMQMQPQTPSQLHSPMQMQPQTHSQVPMQEPQSHSQVLQMQEPPSHSQMLQMQEPQTHLQMQMQEPQSLTHSQMLQMQHQTQTQMQASTQMQEPQSQAPMPMQVSQPVQMVPMYAQPGFMQMCDFGGPVTMQDYQQADPMDGRAPTQDAQWWSQGDLPYVVVPMSGVAPLPLERPAAGFGARVRQYSPPRVFEPPPPQNGSRGAFEPPAEDKPVDWYPGALQVHLPSPSPASPGREKKRRSLTKVFVGGLAPGTTSATLFEHFAKYGAKDAQVCCDAETRRSRGFGYVEFSGKPPPGVIGEVVIEHRKCGVREYDYPGRRRGR
jgi:hypothetical protein